MRAPEHSRNHPDRRGARALAIDYVGDAARLYAGGTLVDDHFYDGEPWFIGVDRFARAGRWPELELEIVPASKDLPIFLEESARQRLQSAPIGAEVRSVRAVLWRSSRVVI